MGNASLVPMLAVRNKRGEVYLPLVYMFPFDKDVGIDQSSVLVKPFRRALEEGKPIGTINYIFYQENEGYFILGAFVFTQHQSILFFPGIVDRRMTVSPDGQEVLRRGFVRTIDHLSLEPNYRNYHITFTEKKTEGTKCRSLNTKRIRHDMFFWFAMSVQNVSRLEPPMSQEIRLKWHNLADLKRKESFISQARGDCVFNVTRVDDHPHEQFFINFEFFVSLNQSKDYPPPSRVTHT